MKMWACNTTSFVTMAPTTPNEAAGQTVGNGQYRLVRKVGSGTFGDVYEAVDLKNSNAKVAVKLEKPGRACVSNEFTVYQTLKGGIGFPNVHWCGVEGQQNVMVMDLLGPSLNDIFKYNAKQFSMKIVLMLADQIIARIEQLHSKLYVHGDIKPENILIGQGSSCNLVHLVDFGFAKKFWEEDIDQHVPLKRNKGFRGNLIFSSINVHRGYEPSRRDDLESIGYVLMYFLKGSLPWKCTAGSTTRQQYEEITKKKRSISPEELCQGCPPEFANYLQQCQSMDFEARPDYWNLRQIFKTLMVTLNHQCDFKFGWLIPPQGTCAGELPPVAASQKLPESDDEDEPSRKRARYN